MHTPTLIAALVLLTGLGMLWSVGRLILASVYRRRDRATAPPLLNQRRRLGMIGVVVMLALLVIAATLLTDWVSTTDAAINDRLDVLRTQPMISVFSWITELGSMPTLCVVAAVTTAFVLAERKHRQLQTFWLVLAGSQITVWSAKYLIARPRPEFVTEVVAYSPSLPSAHAAFSLTVYGAVGWLLNKRLAGRPLTTRYSVAFGSLALAGLIGLSRPLLSVHYVSDVVLGWLIALAWLMVGGWFYAQYAADEVGASAASRAR